MIQLLWVNLIMDALGALGEWSTPAAWQWQREYTAPVAWTLLTHWSCTWCPAVTNSQSALSVQPIGRLLHGRPTVTCCPSWRAGCEWQAGVSVSTSQHHCWPAALATEAPTPDLLTVPPNGQSESIINKRMWKHILTQVGLMPFSACCMPTTPVLHCNEPRRQHCSCVSCVASSCPAGLLPAVHHHARRSQLHPPGSHRTWLPCLLLWACRLSAGKR